jgi:hypothetical protein
LLSLDFAILLIFVHNFTVTIQIEQSNRPSGPGSHHPYQELHQSSALWELVVEQFAPHGVRLVTKDLKKTMLHFIGVLVQNVYRLENGCCSSNATDYPVLNVKVLVGFRGILVTIGKSKTTPP